MHYRRSAGVRSAVIFYVGSLVLCGLGFFSKEEAITLPLVLILVDLFVFDERLNLFRITRAVRYVPFFLLAATYLWIRTNTLGTTENGSGVMIEPILRLITIPAILVDYLLLLLFPFRLDYEPRVPLAGWLGEPRIILSLLFLAAFLAAAPRLARRNRVVFFGMLWYLIVFIPMSNIVPIFPKVAHIHLFTPIHFLYLPSIGVFLCAANIFEMIYRTVDENRLGRRRQRLGTAFFCCVLLAFSLLSIKRNFVWKDELRLYRYMAEMHPENPVIHLNLGNVYLEREQVDAGMEQFKKAVTIAPNVARYRNGLALAYQAKGWFDLAAKEFEEALRIAPGSHEANINLISLYREQGKISESIKAGLKAIKLFPSSSTAHTNLALAYMDDGNLVDAENHFKIAIRLNPDNANVHLSLGVFYAEQGRYALARNEWEKALRLRPDMSDALENLKRLERMGQ